MSRTLSLLGLSIGLVVLGAGCGSGPSYGSPTTPTSSQSQAVTQMDSMAQQLTPTNLLGNPESPLSVYTTMNAVGGLSTSGTSTKALTLAPEAFDSNCFTGDATAGYTYTNCSSNGTTINGTVKNAGGTVTIDLSIKTSSTAANATMTLKGGVTAADTSAVGDLTLDYHIDLGAAAGLPGVGNAGNITTKVKYNLTNISASPRCITGGSIEVSYSASSISKSALFEWTGCDTYTVRNSG